MKYENRIGYCIALLCMVAMSVWIECKTFADMASREASAAIEVVYISPERINRKAKSDLEIEMPEPVAICDMPSVYEPVIALDDAERHIIECIVAGESKGEPYEGKQAVAQCIYNAMVMDGLTASEVRRIYKYSGWDDEPEAYPDVADAVSAVFDRGEMAVDSPILFFYAPKRCKDKWHETQNFVAEIGNHKFFSKNS